MTAAGTLVALGVLNAMLALTVAAILLVAATASVLAGRPLRRVVLESRRCRARLTTTVNERIACMYVVQAHGRESRERERVARESEALQEALIARARIIGRLRAITHTAAGGATIGVLLVGASEVAAGAATPGLVVAALTLVGLPVAPLREVGRVHEYWHGSRVSLDKLQGFLDVEPMVARRGAAGLPQRARGQLVFEGVRVEGALEPLDAEVEPGTFVAIVGANGSGKSTLLDLVARLQKPDAGRVLLDGRDVAELEVRALRRAVGIAGPDLPLMSGSIRKNVRYRLLGATLEEVELACAACGVDEILERTAGGLEARLNERGANLSVGERSRIMLARAIIGAPRVLLLDEIAAHLDAEGREALKRILASYPGTVLAATHDPELTARADVVWRLDAGRLDAVDLASGVGT